MTHASLLELTRIAGLPAGAADSVQIDGADQVIPPPYRVVAPGAAAIAASGMAAAELWALRTGRRQRIALNANATVTAMRSTRYLKIDGKRPQHGEERLSGFYCLKDGRWMYLHCDFFNLRARNCMVLGV